jgi:hypothetical protein
VNCFVSLDFSETVAVFAGVLYVFPFAVALAAGRADGEKAL